MEFLEKRDDLNITSLAKRVPAKLALSLNWRHEDRSRCQQELVKLRSLENVAPMKVTGLENLTRSNFASSSKADPSKLALPSN